MSLWTGGIGGSGPHGSSGRDIPDGHRSEPAPLLGWQILLGGYILGIFALRNHAAAATGLCLLLLFVMLLRHGRPHAGAILLVFLIGLVWANARVIDAPSATPEWMQERQRVHVRARVDKVYSRPGQRVQVLLSDVRCTPEGGTEELLPGRLLWTWQKPLHWPEPGQSVAGVFRIRPVRGYWNPGSWDSEFHWRREGVFYRTFTFQDKAEVAFSPSGEGIRSTLRQRLSATVSCQGGAILAAVLLGERFFLDPATVELMQKSSLAHSLAQSGLHLGLVASLGFVLAWTAGFLRPSLLLILPRLKLGVLMALPLVIFYIWLGQGSPSLLRAGLMFLFWGALLFLGRDRVLIDGLFMALAVILLGSPLSAYDLSLQLSAGAVAGIILLWPVFNGWIAPIKASLWGKILFFPLSLLAVSLAANLALLPLSLSAFGFTSPHLHLNLIWLPLLGFVVLPLGAAGLVLTFLPGVAGLGELLLAVSAGTGDWMVRLLTWLDGRGLLSVVWSMRPTWPLCLAYWMLLLLFVVRTRAARRLIPASIIGLALLFAAVRAWETRHELALTLLDVGQGQAVLLEAGTRRFLIDGGGSFNPDYDIGRAVIGPVLTRGRLPRLDGVVLSHPHADHLRGLFHPLATFRIGFFAENGDRPSGSDLVLLQRSLHQGGLTPVRWQDGELIPLRGGAVIEVLHPPPGYGGKGVNDRSLVLRVVKDGKGLALIPGDLEALGQRHLLGQGGEISAEVLVVPHHGSKSSLVKEFYEAVGPVMALCSNGPLNHFGFPHPDVVQAFSELRIPFLRTDLEGAVTVTWNRSGEISSVRTYRRGSVEFRTLSQAQ
jgi:competence protein ComEC